jgi:dCTP deaminase
MTVLKFEDLRAAMRATDRDERLVIMPLLDREQVGSSSVDLRLGSEFLLLRRTRRAGLDPAAGQIGRHVAEMQDRVTVPLGEGLWLHPGQFVLGSTLEFVRVPPTMAATVESRSSWGRWGLTVATATPVHPGYSGNLTLELINNGESPIRLLPGLRITQLVVHRLTGKTSKPYDRRTAGYFFPVGPEAGQSAWEEAELEAVMAVGRRLLPK